MGNNEFEDLTPRHVTEILGKGRVHFYDSRGRSKGYVGTTVKEKKEKESTDGK